MTEYANVTCDWRRPRTSLDFTARAIYRLVTQRRGQEYLVADVWTAIQQTPGAEVYLRLMAVKALRNMGYPILIKRAGSMTTYFYATTEPQLRMYRETAMKEHWSRFKSIVRAAQGMANASPNDVGLAQQLRLAQMFGLSIATDPGVGLSIVDALQEMQPI